MMRSKKTYHKTIFLNAVLLLLCTIFSCKKDVGIADTPDKVSIYQITAEDVTNFSFLRAAIEKAGLKDQLDIAGSFTLFAPTNQAFKDAGYTLASIEGLSENEALALVKHHLINEVIEVKALQDQKLITADDQHQLTLNRNSFTSRDSSFTQFLVDGADIISADLRATNGNVQVINRVLVYNTSSILETISKGSKYSLFVTALNRASEGSVNYNSLLSGLENYTVFTPINTAFSTYENGKYNNESKIMAEAPDVIGQLVGYHILKGKYFGFQLPTAAESLNQNTIFITKIASDKDIRTSSSGSTFLANSTPFKGFNANEIVNNGIINTISTVLVKPNKFNTLQYIQSQSDLTFLAAAIARISQDSVNFSRFFSGANRYTIFAPNDNAFINGGYPTLSAISKASSSSLSAVLKLHLVEGSVYSTIINTDEMPIKTVSGVNISIGKNGTSYLVKGSNNSIDANVTERDIITKTGVLNKIDLLLK